MADQLRAFLAVDVDRHIREQAIRVQKALQPATPGAKWVDPALCHVTLKFLGSVRTEQVPAIAAAARRAAETLPAFGLSFRGIGAFPRWRGARVLWMGVAEASAPLAGLHAAVERALAPLGFEPEDRPFSPHLTLARFKQPPPPALEEVARQFEHERFGTVPVRELRLMSSELRPSGPTYTVLDAFPLREPA
ncbi:MAG: RNA 2',3'-cyclic phosphodiesterase [Chloroflexota bacterium]